ncbi:MAG: RNA methyltransferase [Bacteroidia bacterium]|nr:RNA methyltransferase [Bacteroidia bacterium]
MLSKAQIKFVKSLQLKKYRQEYCQFVAETPKLIKEMLNSDFVVNKIYANENYIDSSAALIRKISEDKIHIVSGKELSQISGLKSPQEVLAVVSIPESNIETSELKGKYSLVLDNISDPGNLGTIIRTADWFGIENIICSNDCVDLYNPKVIQSTMGSFSRVNVCYCDLEQFFCGKLDLPVYACVLDGQSIYKTDFKSEGLLLLGNEANGIRKETLSYGAYPITIPNRGRGESLNVAITAGIICSEISKSNF